MIKTKKEYIEAFNKGVQLCPYCGSDLNKYGRVEESSEIYVNGKVITDAIVKCEGCDNRLHIKGKFIDNLILDDIAIIKNGMWNYDWCIDDLKPSDSIDMGITEGDTEGIDTAEGSNIEETKSNTKGDNMETKSNTQEEKTISSVKISVESDDEVLEELIGNLIKDLLNAVLEAEGIEKVELEGDSEHTADIIDLIEQQEQKEFKEDIDAALLKHKENLELISDYLFYLKDKDEDIKPILKAVNKAIRLLTNYLYS